MATNVQGVEKALGGLTPEDRSVLRQSITTVGDLMSAKVATMRPDQPVSDAINVFGERQFRHLIVADGGKLAGILSDRDVLRYCIRNRDGGSSPVSGVMTRDPLTVGPGSSVSTAIQLMMSKRINCVPVVDGARMVLGILTTTDLLRALYAVQYWLERNAAALVV